jgi:hypothetical protein
MMPAAAFFRCAINIAPNHTLGLKVLMALFDVLDLGAIAVRCAQIAIKKSGLEVTGHSSPPAPDIPNNVILSRKNDAPPPAAHL